MPNVLSPRDLVSRPDIMDETVPHTIHKKKIGKGGGVGRGGVWWGGHTYGQAETNMSPTFSKLGA